MFRRLLRALALTLLLAAPASAEESAQPPPEPIRIRPLPSKPTKALIQQALVKGIFWGGEDEGDQFAVNADGTASFRGGQIPNWSCDERKPAPRWTVTADSFQWTCDVVTWGGPQIDEDGEPAKVQRPLSVVKTTFRYRVKAVSRDVLVMESREHGRQVLLLSENGNPTGGDLTLVELVPGSPDRALFEKVKARLVKEPGLSVCPVLFEGGPARDPRTTSEVYYARPEAKDTAEELAELLKPVLGKVEVKPWPGAWDYDVILVVGKAAAP
jgi:hypothetical protein